MGLEIAAALLQITLRVSSVLTHSAGVNKDGPFSAGTLWCHNKRYIEGYCTAMNVMMIIIIVIGGISSSLIHYDFWD